jgi:hypothetical protein
MTPLEERLQQALTARAEQITHETVYPARPPAPARPRPGRVMMTTTVLAAAAAAAIVATVTFTSLGRPGTAPGPAGTGGRTVALGTSSPAAGTTSPSSAATPEETTAGRLTKDGQLPPATSRPTGTDREATVQMRPEKLAAGSTASFRGSCPNPGGRGTVASKAFLKDADHEVDGMGAQTFTVKANGTIAGSIAVQPDVAADSYDVLLWCGSTDGEPDQSTTLAVLEAQEPGTDQDIRLAAHAVYPGEWIAFSGVCVGGATATSGWVMSPAFEAGDGHEYAGVGAVAFSSDPNGVFVGTAHIPDDREAGMYEVTVRCSGGVLSQRESLDVLAP